MAQFTFNVELTTKPDQTGRSSVMIRVHLKGHLPGRVLTGVKIEHAERNWAALDRKRDKKPEWRKWVIRHIDKEKLNAKIHSEYERIKKQVETWQQEEPGVFFTPALIAERFRAATGAAGYFEKINRVLSAAEDQAYGTWRGKRTVVNAFKDFAGEQLPADMVTPVLIRQFQHHLTKTVSKKTSKRLSASTINSYMDSMHALHKAMLIADGISPKQADLLSPWNDRDRLSEPRGPKLRLTESTIERVSTLEIATTRRKVTPEIAFHLWRLSHLLAGARFSDVLQLRYQNFSVDAEGNPVGLSYEMMKTGFQINMPLFDEAQELLKRWWAPDAHKPTDYVLPFLSNTQPYAQLTTYQQYKQAPFAIRSKLAQALSYWNHQVNRELKEVQREAKLSEKLSTHNARHSFADRARRIMQQDKSISLYDIQLMLGHGEYKTTVGYIEELSGQDSTEAMSAVFNRKPAKKSKD